MGEYVPLYVALGIIIVLGVLVPFLVNDLVEEIPEQNQSIITPIVRTIQEGWTIEIPLIVTTKNITMNPFDNAGREAQQKMASYFGSFAYIPNWLLVPMMIIIIMSLVYVFIKLLPTT